MGYQNNPQTLRIGFENPGSATDFRLDLGGGGCLYMDLFHCFINCSITTNMLSEKNMLRMRFEASKFLHMNCLQMLKVSLIFFISTLSVK